MAAAFSFAYSLLKDDDMPFNKKKDGGARKERNLENARASKVEHAQERMRTGPTEDLDNPDEYDTEDGSKKPIGEDEDTGYDLRTTEEREDELKMRKSAFDMALKALNSSQQDDLEPFSERRHARNLGRQMRIFDSAKDFGAIGSANEDHPSQLPEPMPLPPHEEMPLRNVGTTSYPSKNRGRGGANTLPPNPARMPPGADSPNATPSAGRSNYASRRGLLGEDYPKPLETPPVSDRNPTGKISTDQLQRLADEFGIPFAKAYQNLRG
jgi:hypothetical protein